MVKIKLQKVKKNKIVGIIILLLTRKRFHINSCLLKNKFQINQTTNILSIKEEEKNHMLFNKKKREENSRKEVTFLWQPFCICLQGCDFCTADNFFRPESCCSNLEASSGSDLS